MPHSTMELMMGISDSPNSLKAYSVRMGVSGITVRVISPAASISFKFEESTFWLMPGMARCNALKPKGCSTSC